MSFDEFGQCFCSIRVGGWPVSSQLYLCKGVKKRSGANVLEEHTTLISFFRIVIRLIRRGSDKSFDAALRLERTVNKACLILTCAPGWLEVIVLRLFVASPSRPMMALRLLIEVSKSDEKQGC